MKGDRDILLLLSAGAIELIWLYACAIFIIIPLLNRPFPLPEALGTFALAALLTLVVRGRGWRVIMILGLHLSGLLLAASKVVHVLFYGGQPLWAQWWLVLTFRQSKGPMEWIALIAVLFLVALFWVGGVALGRRSGDYLTISARFDVGVAAFFCLLMVKFLVLLKGGPDLWGAIPELLLFPFFLFGLMAIAMARNRSSARKDFLSGYHAIGIIVSSTVVVLAFGTGLVLLFLPYLSAAADMGYGLLKSAAVPLGSLFVSIIQFLFGHNRVRMETSFSISGRTDGASPSAVEHGWWGEMIEKILTWGVVGLGIAIAALCFLVVLWFLVRWLLSRTDRNEETDVQWRSISRWLTEIWSALRIFGDKIIALARGCRNAVDLYQRLLRWGRQSGIPRHHSETPREYGLRLSGRFPELGREIETIAEAFNREVYGGRILDARQFQKAATAWSRMRSPQHWPSRCKSLFLGGQRAVGT